MKFKNLFLLLFLSLTAICCKDEAKKEGSPEQNQEAPASTNTFKVTLTLVAKNNDNFCMLYTDDGSLNFKEGVWKEVKGSLNEQTVEFSIPNNIYPTQLRLDLGKNQDEILFKSVKFEYHGKVREAKGYEAGVFFHADPSKCTYDATSAIIKPLVKDEGKKEISLYPQETILGPELLRFKG